MLKRIGSLALLLMLIFETNCWANQKVNDANEVFANHHDIYLLLNLDTNYQKFSDANDKAYMSGGRLVLKYRDDKDMQPTLKALGQLSIVYQAINHVWQYRITSRSMNMPRNDVIWEAFPRLNLLKRNSRGHYDSRAVMKTLISYVPEREEIVLQEIDNLKDDKSD